MLVAFALAAAAPASPPAPPSPPCSSAEYRQLDFWVGSWDLSFDDGTGKRVHGINRITRDEFGDCVIAEHFERPDNGNLGASFSTYDRNRRQWVQTWVDNGGGYIILAGGPVAGQKWTFELRTLEPRGPKKVYSRMIWQDVKPDSLTWRWQQQQADGRYSDVWVIDYTRRK